MYRRRFLEPGCDHLLIKQVDLEDLHRLLESCKQNHCPTNPKGRVMNRAPPEPDDLMLGATRTRELVEVVFIMPTWQTDQLEQAAHRRGVTTGELFRRLIAEFLERESTGNQGAK
jgi:hypothetical protein